MLIIMLIVLGLAPALVIAADTAQPTCPQPVPQPSNWTECQLRQGAENATQSRITYECDTRTETYTTKVETRECEAGYAPLPLSFMGTGALLAVGGTAGAVIWRRRMPKSPVPQEKKGN